MKKVIIIGAGGHAKAIIDCLHQLKDCEVIGITNNVQYSKELLGYKILGDDTQIYQYDKSNISLINGIGYLPGDYTRRKIYKKYAKLGYEFNKVISPFTSISQFCHLNGDIQVLAGSIIQAESVIGKNVIINTSVTINHDCRIGDHVHIAPGVTLCGGVSVGNGTFIGAGATIIQGITIGSNCIIGAGAVVKKNILDNKTFSNYAVDTSKKVTLVE